jgi:hypothetical protein
MKKYYFLIPLIFLCATGFAQSRQNINSLKQLISQEKNPVKKFDLYVAITTGFAYINQLDSMQYYNQELFKIAVQAKNDSLLMEAYDAFGTVFFLKSDTKEAIDYTLKALAIAEKKYPSKARVLYKMLSYSYNDIDNPSEALRYARKSKMLIEYSDDPNWSLMTIYQNFSDAFFNLHQPDSALHYARIGMEMAANDEFLFQRPFLSLMGKAYEQLGNDKLAESYYASSIMRDTSDESIISNLYFDAQTLQPYVRFLLKQGNLNKAKFYGLKAVEAAEEAQGKRYQLEAVSAMRQIYEAMHRPDSAYYFAGRELALRDSMFNQKKLNEIQSMTFNEKIREQEEAIKKSEEERQHKQNVEYAFIALGILLLVMLFFLFSHSVVANEGLIRFLGVLSLLILYEFINLLIHPFLAKFTHESPVWMLIIMVAIGAILVPLHHKVEQWTTHKLIAKNNKIRLAAAKKTIEKLEGKKQ